MKGAEDDPRETGAVTGSFVQAGCGETVNPEPHDGSLTISFPSRPDEAEPLPLVPGYEILSVLGRGGMGVVYQARHLKLNRVVALKMILGGAHAGASELARFRTEAEAVARLQHPNIVQIHEIGEHAGLPFFSLEYCGGGNLAMKIQGTPMQPAEAARLVQILAEAMHAAHEQNILHRDLKPANVLLTTGGIPKITDFGLAKKLDDAGQTHSGSVMGTPSYMPPEQAEGNVKTLGPGADVYTLGAILYELLTGRPPFKASTPVDTLMQVLFEEPVPPRRLQSKLPRDLETICLKCLQKDPHKRYADASSLAEEVRRFRADEPILARPVSRLERAWRWCRRHPARVAAAALAVVVLVVVPILFAVTEAANSRRLSAALKDSRRQAATSTLERALALCEQGDVPRGLLLLTQGLHTATEAEAGDLQDAFRWNLGTWARKSTRSNAS